MPLISVPELTRFAEDVLIGAGVPADKAEVTAACLIASNLRGVDSHGMQLLPFYVDQLLAGEMDPRTDGRVISESGSCLLFDGQNGIGQWIADICCEHAVRIAREQGMAMVVARESNHFGAAAWWAQKMRAARPDRDRDVQRFADRAAVAGQGRARRNEPDLRGAARVRGCWIWRPPRWRPGRSSKPS